MIISASGIVIRTDASHIKRSGRSTQGVIMMNLADGDVVVAVATTNGKKSDDQLAATLEAEQNGDIVEEISVVEPDEEEEPAGTAENPGSEE
jgi:DNA gyrase subunit A